MSISGKVSIIMPCYNSEKTIERAILGVVNQTYRPIEFILVNDGSYDGTEKIIESMTETIKNGNIEFKYIKQINLGLGGAINTGLKHITGDYLAWVDADDELISNSIEVRVNYLISNPQYGCVTSNAYIVNGDNWDHPLGFLTNDIETNSKEDQFYEMLMGRSIFCSGCHLVRIECFDKANPERDIYPARHGQNWQMLLPIYYHYKRGFINEPLYKYGIYENNMTAQLTHMPTRKISERNYEYIEIIKKTLEKIPGIDPDYRSYCERQFTIKCIEQSLFTAIGSRDLLKYIQFLYILIKLKGFKFYYLSYPIKSLIKKMKGKLIQI